MVAYIYGRVSHRDSGASGLSEASQLHAAKTYIETVLGEVPLGQTAFPIGNAPGYYFDRAVSAWKSPFTKREGACALTQVLKRGDHVVFYNLERGFRSTLAFCQQMLYWEEQGINAHFIVEGLNFSTPEGKLMLRVMAAYAEYYSDLVSARTKEALRIKRLGQLQKTNKQKSERGRWESSNFQFATEKPVAVETTGRILTYARCSHIDSELSGLGMKAQLDGITRYANRLASMRPTLSNPNMHFEDNSVSAFHVPFHQRPGGKALLECAQSGDVIIVYRTDRIFRHPIDVARVVDELTKRGIAIHIVEGGIDTSTHTGQMFIHMLTLFAYMESSIKSKRNRDVIAYLRSQGRPHSRPPRYAKVVTDKNTKKLAYDYEQIVMSGAAYVMRDILGMTVPQISDIMHAISCSRSFTKPVLTGFRKANWGLTHVHECLRDFRNLKNTLPPEAIADALRTAGEILSQDLNTFFKAHVKTQFPLKDVRHRIEGHLAADEIAAPLP